MPIATKLETYLAERGAQFDTLNHRHTDSSLNTASTSHVPAESIAKTVVLEDDDGYLAAVIPASYYVKLEAVAAQFHREMLLAPEDRLGLLFDDCEMGAIPAIGQAYGLRTVMDSALKDATDIYFEAGDHEALVHMSGDQFRELMGECQVGEISSPH